MVMFFHQAGPCETDVLPISLPHAPPHAPPPPPPRPEQMFTRCLKVRGAFVCCVAFMHWGAPVCSPTDARACGPTHFAARMQSRTRDTSKPSSPSLSIWRSEFLAGARFLTSSLAESLISELFGNLCSSFFYIF